MKVLSIGRPPVRYIVGSIGLVVVIAGAIGLLRSYNEFRHELRKLDNVQLGDSRAEVTFRLGPPLYVLGPPAASSSGDAALPLLRVNGPAGDRNSIPANRSALNYNDWVYFLPSRGADLIIQFGRNGLVNAVECAALKPDPSSCGAVAGLRSLDTEERVAHHLGAPSAEHLIGSAKVQDFEDIGLQIHFAEGKIYSFRIAPKTYGERGQMLRFVRTLAP